MKNRIKWIWKRIYIGRVLIFFLFSSCSSSDIGIAVLCLNLSCNIFVFFVLVAGSFTCGLCCSVFFEMHFKLSLHFYCVDNLIWPSFPLTSIFWRICHTQLINLDFISCFTLHIFTLIKKNLYIDMFILLSSCQREKNNLNITRKHRRG